MNHELCFDVQYKLNVPTPVDMSTVVELLVETRFTSTINNNPEPVVRKKVYHANLDEFQGTIHQGDRGVNHLFRNGNPYKRSSTLNVEVIYPSKEIELQISTHFDFFA